MADPILGLTGTDIKNHVIKYIGNDSKDFETWVDVEIPLAEHRILKLHDWSYLRFTDFTLTLVNGTKDYELNSTNVSELTTTQTIDPDSIEIIHVPETGVTLRKMDKAQMIRFDPQEDDGSDGSDAQGWARLDHKTLRIYPPNFKNQTALLNGRRQEASLTTLSNTLQIPYKFQNSYIKYLEALALDRENDDRAISKKAESASLILEDMDNDMQRTGDVSEPRIKDLREAAQDGFAQQLNSILFATIT